MTTRARTLVCTKSFQYDDPWMGRQICTRGLSYAVEDAWVAENFPSYFAPSDRQLGVTRDMPIHDMRIVT